MQIVFRDVIAIREFCIGGISACVVHDEPTEFLFTALEFDCGGGLPSEHPYRHYMFLDDDDQAILEIVAAEQETLIG